jgi:ubiquinone/menaquinone biosynthesis C-methylase UbiE
MPDCRPPHTPTITRGTPGTRFHHPLAYLIGLEGLALMRAWGDDHSEEFVRGRLAQVRALLDDERLTGHPGVHVETDRTRGAYASWAATYDDDGNPLLEMDLPVIEAVLDRLAPGTAVDAACGTGRLAARLVVRGYDVTGVDDSPEMLALARARVPGATFRHGDLRQLPVSDGSADLVVSGLALTHVPELGVAFGELARVLRPGGTAIVSDVHPELVYRGSAVKGEDAEGRPIVAASHHHTVADYLRAAVHAGFVVRGLEELTARPDDEPAEPNREVGEWRWWPWTLLEWDPEAAKVAWDTPSVIVWHLEKSP